MCFVVVWLLSILSISFRVTLLALGQSYDCPSAGEATLKDMGNWFTKIHNELYYYRIKPKPFSYIMGNTAGYGAMINEILIKFSTQLALWAENLLGWGLLSQFSLFRYFPHFPLLSKQTLAVEYHVYIWQVSPQLSCGELRWHLSNMNVVQGI